MMCMAPRISRQIEYRLGNQPSSGAGLLKAVDDLISVSVRDLMEANLLSLAPFRGRWPPIVLLLVSSLFSLDAALCASVPALSQQASGEAIQ